MRFILSRTDDFKTRSKKWIVGYALLFWLITRLIAALTVILCVSVYKTQGIDPTVLTTFGGSPSQIGIHSLLYSVVVIMLIAPLLEEGVFRLGLSFRKWQVALAGALIPVAVVWQNYLSFSVAQYIFWLGLSVVVFCGIYYGSKQEMWIKLKTRYLVAASWITAIGFGLMHLLAFSTLTWALLPYCLCIILVPFFAGCACTYLRVNIGFWWAVALHIFNNLPALLILTTM